MIKLEDIFADGIVLQRDMEIPVWGKCVDVDRVVVTLGDNSAGAVIEDGSFFAKLPPLAACTEVKFEVQSYCRGMEADHIEIKDAAVGEVWIAGGQSNMEFPLRHDCEADTVMKLPEDGLFRYYDVRKVSYDGQEHDMDYSEYGFWRRFNAEDCGWFSSVAAYFGLKLRSGLKVPVGIIGCNWGATSASCWLERGYLEEYPELMYYIDAYESSVKDLDRERYRELFFKRQRFGQTPRVREINEAISKGELAGDGLKKLVAGLTAEQLELLSLPVGPMDHTRPCYLFDSMVKRIAGYASRGVIWYQGEADEVLPGHYALLFSQLVRCWRKHWGRELPFLCVQLAPFGEWLSNTGKQFPTLRSQQELASSMLDGVWLASIMDCGMEYDIHPKSKRAAGERLALLAFGKVYGQDILCEAPCLGFAEWGEDSVILHMENAGEGLRCDTGIPEGLRLLENGEDVDFTARLEGSRIILSCRPLKSGSQVEALYAWQPYVRANLYSSAGLCAKPFMAVRPQASLEIGG